MCYSCDSRKFFIYAKIFDKKGRLLSSGYNSYVKTDPHFNRVARSLHLPIKEYIHAEFSAIKHLNFNDISRAYKICIYRFGEHGRPLLAKPCPICSKLIKGLGLKVHYTDEDNPLDMDYEEYKYLKDTAKFWIKD